MTSAITDALQSLGLTLPSGATSAASSPTSADGSGDGAPSGAGTTKSDLRHFMHQLFEAVKGESTPGGPASPSNAPASADPQSAFGAGLTSLIAQVSNGTAPPALQSAFAQLSSDLSAASAAAPAGNSDASQATLQAFLTRLQQELGYGPSGVSASGSLVKTQG